MKKSDNMKKVLGLIVFFLVMVIVSLFIGVVSAESEEIAIDTEKGVPGFRTEPARDLPGNWQYVHDHPDSSADGWFDTYAYPPEQGNGSFWYTISFPGMKECKGIWETSLPYTGKYEVFAWIPDPDPFDPYLDESTPPSVYLPTKRAQYKIFHNGGVATVTVDQNVNRGGFTSLGVFEFDTTARVELSSNGVEFWRCVAFDAVKFVPIVNDMAVTDVTIIPQSMSVGQSTAICVTVTNEGSQQEENVYVKAFVDGAQVGATMYVSLDPGASDTMAFLWVPRAAKKYSVEGEVRVVSGETDMDDNTKAVEVEVPAIPAPAPISGEESGDRRFNVTTQAVRQEFVWDDDSGTFQTISLFIIGNVSDYIANMTEILQRGASDEPHGSHTITKVGENPLNYTYWNCSQSQWVTLPNVNRYEGQNSSVEGVIDRYDRYYYNDCSGENRVEAYAPRITISLANGWNISVYASSYTTCGYEIWFIAPDGDIALLYGDPHLLQAHGTQQQELAALGYYVFDLDENYILNASCMKSHAGFSVVTNVTITGPNNYTVTIGRNSEVKVSGGTAAGDETPPHIHFFTYPLESTSNNYALISINGSEPLNSALLEWNGINETMEGSGRDWYINKTNLGSTYIYKVYGNDSNGNWGVTEEKQVEIKTLAPPNITSFSPPSPVNDTVCTWRTFNVTVNQTVNASWYLNGTLQFTNESVREASCRLHANVTGVHNVTAIASNANGTDMQTWIWNVTPSAPSKIIYPDFTDTDTPGSWRTWIGVMNTGDASTTLNLTIYNQDGSLAYSNPDFVTLEPKAAHFFRPGITAGIAQGSTIVSGDNLAGTCHESKNDGDGAKVYTAVTSSSPTLYYPDFTDTDTIGNWRTWMGVVNAGDTSTTLRLDVYNPDGSLAYSNANFVTLEPKAAHFFRPGITAGIAQGCVVVSGANLAGTCHVNKNGGEGTKVYTALTSGSSTLYYPDFTDTDTIGNWRTWLGVMNTGDASTTLNLTIYNPDGSLAYSNANFITLEPKAAHFFRPGITAGIAQGDVVVSGDNLAGTCHVNKNGGEGTKVYTALSSGSSTLNYPDFTDTDIPGNWRTWMGVMNTGAASTTVRLDVYNADGSLAYSNANFVTLEPKATHFFRPGITAGIAQGDVVVSGDNLAGTCHVNKNGGVGTKVYTAIGV